MFHHARNLVVTRSAGVALAMVLTAAAALGQSLDARVRSILSDPKLGNAKTGVIIIDASSGDVLAAHRADESLIPASNMKLVTSGAAVAVLGSNFAFETKLMYDQSVAGGRVVLVGSGDPTLADPKLLQQRNTTVESVLQTWITALRGANVPAGVELVIDDRVFDRQFVHPSWPVEQLNRWYCSEVSGVNFHTNLLSIFAQPLEQGRPPSVKIEPAAPWLEIRNKAKSVKQGSNSAWAARDGDRGLTLHGDVRYGNDPISYSLNNMPDFIARLLADRMTAAGMKPAKVRLATDDEDLAAGRVVHSIRTPIADVLRRCNVDSYNLYAEALIKRMGHEVTRAPGSWANGSAVVRMVLQEHLGIEAGQAFTVADGSGMSRNNRVTPRMLSQWLKSLADDSKIESAFITSLPQAGEEGTLRRRFRSHQPVNEVRAKTGYLSGVSAISGYVTDEATSQRLIFAIITNDKPNRVQLSAVREAEEKIIRAADDWISKRSSPGAAGSR